MSIIIVEAGEPVTYTKERRTRRVTIDTPKNGCNSAVFEREIVTLVGTDVLQATSAAVVRRSCADTMAETVTLADGTVITCAQVADAVSMFGDLWDDEDNAVLPYPAETSPEAQ